ncbi:hypothetical protein CEUSTIGMA_g5033.t1 [Chlamydomonas eustigma]|uniref:Uncharacterized protein n=1 Tax=Chlamydomonas eustigma TaxID=1157962 RepID=A0A250X3U3_9CHLO|nr:hypothetical protein CEUSTIGMA_g5033.t1 [Chlamydomonas eustigma]|eukprot:GAX77589.1 hypothetical protein CEUSTIGMA_g5033.t1 [Chlamydomonas eustigma]
MASNIMPSLTLPQAIQDEFQLEGSMHVTWFSAVSCEAAYGLPQIMSAPQTSILEEDELRQKLNVKVDESSGSTVSFQMKLRKGDMSVKSLAACLATPSEGIPDSPERPLQQSRVSNTNLSITRSSATTAGGVYEKEEKCEAEECYWGMAGTSEQLSAAEMRWRDWMRRIRRKRIAEMIQSLLMKVATAPAALFSSDSS